MLIEVNAFAALTFSLGAVPRGLFFFAELFSYRVKRHYNCRFLFSSTRSS